MELSVWMGVFPWGWPISIRAFHARMTPRKLRNIAPISASAALDITALMSWVMLSTAPLFVGIGASFDRKRCPPAGLRALGSLKYKTSLCTARIISFLRYVRTASRWVAA